MLVRYGGEEFLALLPDTDAAGALTMATRLRLSLEETPIMFEQGGHEPVSIVARASVGVASLSGRVDSAAELISLADRAMYRAKALGRGRVELAAA